METRLSQDWKTLDAAATCLDSVVERSSSTIRGTRKGVGVALEIPTLGGGWTVRCEAPQVAFAMDVAESAGYGEPRERLAVDSGAFDALYTVEGAPENVVAELLDSDTRELILGLRPRRVLGRAGEISVEKRYSYYWAESSHISQAIELALSLASRVASAVDRDDRELMEKARAEGSPYRGSLDTRAADAARRRREERVVALTRRQHRRMSRTVKLVAVGGLLYAGIGLLAVLLDLVF